MFQIYQNLKNIIRGHDPWFIALKNIRDYSYHFLNQISHYQLERNKFYRELGYPLNLKNPESFNEKIVWNKIYDRNPLLPITADKYAVRSYLQKVLGKEKAEEILIPLLYVTDQPESIPFESLPPDFIVKPNHASGKYIMVEQGSFDQKEIIKTCKRWLRTPYGLEKLEWAYQSIKRKIVIEELLHEDGENFPKRFKFHLLNNKCKLVQVMSGKPECPFVSHFDEQWNFLSVKLAIYPQGPRISKPTNFEAMLELAETLSEPFNYIRVDLYNINGKIYFGELTHYSSSGIGKFEHRPFDFELGSQWKIKPGYWKKN